MKTTTTTNIDTKKLLKTIVSALSKNQNFSKPIVVNQNAFSKK